MTPHTHTHTHTERGRHNSGYRSNMRSGREKREVLHLYSELVEIWYTSETHTASSCSTYVSMNCRNEDCFQTGFLNVLDTFHHPEEQGAAG